jgi:hypothetical protein
MLRVQCPNCGHNLKYPPENAGKKARCQKCGESFALPGAGGDVLAALGRGAEFRKVAVYAADRDDVWRDLLADFAKLPAYALVGKDPAKRIVVYRDEQRRVIGFEVGGEDGKCELRYASNDREVTERGNNPQMRQTIAFFACAATMVKLDERYRRLDRGCRSLFAAILLVMASGIGGSLAAILGWVV